MSEQRLRATEIKVRWWRKGEWFRGEPWDASKFVTGSIALIENKEPQHSSSKHVQTTSESANTNWSDLITAVVNSIDRSMENRAPNRCLPFDGIGARHPGIVPRPDSRLRQACVHSAPRCRGAEPQYHQKVNNDLGLYSLWNGLSN